MLTLALVLFGAAAALHVYIFWLESFAWTSPRGLRTFGMRADQAEATRELAYNQGFYNFFLAAILAVGVVLRAAGHDSAGTALLVAGAGSMTLAGVVLGLSSPAKRRAALVQLTLRPSASSRSRSLPC